MRIVVCWTNIAGYTAACWRALAARPGIDLHVVCFRPEDNARHTQFQEHLLRGIPHTFLSSAEIKQPEFVAKLVAAHDPHIVVISGWSFPCFTRLPDRPELARSQFMLAMDTPWRGDLRQRVAKYFLAGYLRRMAAVLVAGDKARHYAIRLGVPESRIHRGLYAYDNSAFNEGVLHNRIRGNRDWPRRFLFVGRYAPEKAIDVLVAAYQAYRRRNPDAWPLDCCGMGELKGLLSRAKGVTDLGFVQPDAQAELFADYGVLVLPSRYEPWGVVVAEAMATAMPVICTTACGAQAELLRPYTTGIEIPVNDVRALTDAFAWMHSHHDRLPLLGQIAMQTARPFGSDHWAERLETICHSLPSNGRS